MQTRLDEEKVGITFWLFYANVTTQLFFTYKSSVVYLDRKETKKEAFGRYNINNYVCFSEYSIYSVQYLLKDQMSVL